MLSGKVIDVLITLLRSMGAQSPVEEVIWNSPPPVLWLLGGRLHEHMAFSGTQKEKKEKKEEEEEQWLICSSCACWIGPK
jgi:hypothetical protein